MSDQYRAIDVTGEKRLPMPSQAAPVLQWVRIADLVVDGTYQRDLTPHSWASIRRIAEGFDWSHFGAILVAPVEGGRFAVIDGQHRSHAAAIFGVESVPAIMSILPVSAQARAFAVVNSSTVKVSPVQVYRAALASGEDWAMRCRAAVEAAGCRLMTSNSSTDRKAAGDVYAVTLVREMIAKDHAEAVTVGLSALMDHAGHIGDVAGKLLFRDDMLRPWLGVLMAHPGFVTVDLKAFLRRNRLLNILESAARLKQQSEYASVPMSIIKRNALVAKIMSFAREAP